MLLSGTLEPNADCDALTGLANRQGLFEAMDCAIEKASVLRPWTVTIFDLDGLGPYNKKFGFDAGDQLMGRLGARAKVAANLFPGASVFRLGGDEFCLLIPGDKLETRTVVQSVATALTEIGNGYSVTTTLGSATVPDDADTRDQVICVAGDRLQEHKNLIGGAVGQTIRKTLLNLLAVEPFGSVASDPLIPDMAEMVGRELNLPTDELTELAIAAGMRDDGMAAMPKSMLDQPGPLDKEEWSIIHLHTLIGERVVKAIPGMDRVGELIRWSHEKFDGSGYPDGLIGEQIPLAARIVSVCDAYNAITHDRPYQKASSHKVAIAELRAHAGTQFDPDVVEAFAQTVEVESRFRPPRLRSR